MRFIQHERTIRQRLKTRSFESPSNRSIAPDDFLVSAGVTDTMHATDPGCDLARICRPRVRTRHGVGTAGSEKPTTIDSTTTKECIKAMIWVIASRVTKMFTNRILMNTN
jgi:hypothetical protein